MRAFLCIDFRIYLFFVAGVILWNLPPSKYDNIVCASQVEPGVSTMQLPTVMPSGNVDVDVKLSIIFPHI